MKKPSQVKEQWMDTFMHNIKCREQKDNNFGTSSNKPERERKKEEKEYVEIGK
jgi:hypothetical protein